MQIKMDNKSNQEINRLIELKVFNNPYIYELRDTGAIVERNITMDQAQALIEFEPEHERYRYTVQPSQDIPDYAGSLDATLEAVKAVIGRFSTRDNLGVLITYFPSDGGWKATIGDIEDCIDVIDPRSPSRAMCIAILRFLGVE